MMVILFFIALFGGGIFIMAKDLHIQKINSEGLVAIWVIMCFVIFFVLYSGSYSHSSSSSEPWHDLGVSKQEYMKTYNKIKYGE